MSDYQIARIIDGFLFRWPELGYEVELTRYHATKTFSTAHARFIDVTGGGRNIITETKINLSNVEKRSLAVKNLHERCPSAAWATIIEVLSVVGERKFKEGEPPVALDADSEPDHTHTPFILSPLIYSNLPTILYGPGDSGKSFLALYAAMLLASGGHGAGLAAPNPLTGMILDWELSAPDMQRRMSALRRGQPDLSGTKLIYKSMTRPLIDSLSDLVKGCREAEVRFLVIDSLVPAAGGEPKDANTAAEFFGALKTLNLPALIVGHTPKDNPQFSGGDDASGSHRTIFGSTFFFNLSRQVWEVKAIHPESGGGDLKIGLYQRKNNMGRRHDALGFALSFTDDACSITDYNLGDDEFLNPEGSAIGAVKAALRNADNEPKTLAELSAMTGIKRGAIEKALQRAEKRGEIEKFCEEGGGRGKKATYWLPIPNSDTTS